MITMGVRTGVGAAVRTVMVGLVLSPLVAGCGSAPRLAASDAMRLGQPSETRPADAGVEAEPEEEAVPAPRGSEDWRIDRPARHGEVAAYTTRASGVPGTRVGLKVSTTEGGYEVAAFRIGAYEGGTGAFVWESGR